MNESFSETPKNCLTLPKIQRTISIFKRRGICSRN